MVGEFPMIPLGQVVENFDSKRIPLSNREREKRCGPYPYYGATGVMDYVDGYLFDGLYLLVAEDGSVETKSGFPFLQLVGGKFWVNNHAHVLRGLTDTDTRYLYYALSTIQIRPYMTGSVQAKLSQGNMNRIPIPFPQDEVTRAAIAGILGTLDDKIELNRRMNETLEATAQALFKSWFVDFDPICAKAEGRDPGLPPHIAGLFPDEFEESELGEIPQGWRVEPIGNIVKAVGGGTPSTKNPAYWDEGIYCFATPKDLSGLASPMLLDTERRVTDAGLAKISSGLLPVGTVLLSSRAPVGYLALAQTPVCVNQGFIAMICDGAVSNYYVLNWVDANMPEIKRRAGGTTFAEISKTNFRPIPALVPRAEVIAAFDAIVEPLYDKIRVNLESCRTLAALRDTLLPKLISGELRVPDAERIVGRCA